MRVSGRWMALLFGVITLILLAFPGRARSGYHDRPNLLKDFKPTLTPTLPGVKTPRVRTRPLVKPEPLKAVPAPKAVPVRKKGGSR